MISILYHPIIIGLLVVFCSCNWSEYCSDISVYLSTLLEINQHQIGLIESCDSFPLWYHLCKRGLTQSARFTYMCKKMNVLVWRKKGLKRPSLVLRRSNKSIGAGKKKVSSSPGRVGGMARPIRVAKLFSPFGLSSTDLFPFIVMVFWYILLNLPCQCISIKKRQDSIYIAFEDSRKYLYGALTQRGWSIVTRIKALI